MAWAKDPEARRRQEQALERGRAKRAENLAAKPAAAKKPRREVVRVDAAKPAAAKKPPAKKSTPKEAPRGSERDRGEGGGFFAGLLDQFF